MQTIGERLEEARKKKGISIREAAEATKIRGDYLQKFESNHFDIGLTEIYTRGFLRTYANFLKVPADRILNDYAALGHGDIRPRQPNREVYGRMDISVSSASEASERAGKPEEGAGAEAGAAKPAGRSRGATSLPTGPDPAVVFRYVKWGAFAVLGLVVILVAKSLLGGGGAPAPAPSRPTTPAPAAASAPAPRQNVITLIAKDAVFVRVCEKNADNSEGADLFKGTLSARQAQPVPWNGPLFISFSAGENLEVEFNGRRTPTGMRGASRVQLGAPGS